ncbi:MFS transporter [Leucobacter sp. UCMA 4100]|uniref:MFS transporter n=1 Tax=Leucobacter sp. UCMA 4100 TaxID=2810534 RepID=UPI0022EB03FA|nr:MFS transporter [Leucobacter sp. UCMA 4100]MDA3148032.1 MFS transporter [Leucobacter sp. UCMA 4100]
MTNEHSGEGHRADRLYSALVKRNPEAEQQLPPEVQQHIAPNGLRQVLANALQSSGDQTVNASTVLPWLFSALGVPPALTGLLVPIRESGSMLPQAALTPLVVRVRYRKWILVVGALIQALSVAVMAGTAALGSGLAAGLTIIVALAVFSFGRCLASIASKDVLGRTIPKGERGQINGLATTAAGLVAITLGLAIRIIGGEELAAGQIAWLLAAGSLLWFGVALVYAGIREPAGEPGERREAKPESEYAHHWFRQMLTLLSNDKLFRHFVTVRGLLLVSALSPPFVVSLSIQSGSASLAGLGGFIIASGVAALLGGRVFGKLADRSSGRLMSVGAGIASGIIIVTVLIVSLPGFHADGFFGNLLFIAVYFMITLMHTGVRVARKTYVVDMAEGDKRTAYVAVSNSAMGVILLAVGGVSSALAAVHTVWALLFLALLGLVGVFVGARLPK